VVSERIPNKSYVLLTYVVLALATFIAFEQVRHNEFVYDDSIYVTDSPQVKEGLTYQSVLWAFTTPHAAFWHPLTSLSHMLDCHLFGLNPSWHHLTNLLFHIANTLLLFGILKRMTGAIWQSGFVAAAFALHPLHVESVAWVAERKDVLSSFFWMLTMAAYVRYAERPTVRRYLLAFLALCLGLMAKPMLVTLPFVLLLLDYWPLGRFQWSRQNRENALPQSELLKVGYKSSSARHLVVEKIPLLVPVAVSSIIAFAAQQSAGALKQAESLTLNVRIANALVSYVSYIVKMFYPRHLAVLYPHMVDRLPLWQPIVSFLILAVVSAVVIYAGRRRRYLAVGWLWYLGTLVPVSGLIQVGSHAMADRYTYLPSIGIFIMVAWGAAELVGRLRYGRTLLRISAGLLFAVLIICTRIQIKHWQNDLTLYGHTLEVTKSNYIMHNNYGYSLFERGRFDEAAEHFAEALRIKPGYLVARNNMGRVFLAQEKFDKAVECFTEVLQLEPDNTNAINNLGTVMKKQGKTDEAVKKWKKVIEIDPAQPYAHFNLGAVYYERGRLDLAIIHWTETVKSKPDSIDALNNLAWVLAASEDTKFRNPVDAIKFAERACELTEYNRADFLDTLAVAYAAAGRFTHAIETAEKAVKLAQSTDKKVLAAEIQERLQLYKTGHSYLEKQPWSNETTR